MKYNGKAQYGENAYKPGGSLIDTNKAFNVWTEFVSTTDYTTFWKLRTTLTQEGRTLTMEADCGSYLDALNIPIEGNMGFSLSSWDNTDMAEDVDCDNLCPTPAATCDNAMNIVSNFSVNTWGSTENPDTDPNPPEPEPPAPEPEPEPPAPEPTPTPTWHEFWGTAQDAQTSLWVMGVGSDTITAANDEITVGGNNRAFVFATPDESSETNAFMWDLLGGSLTFDVDVSGVGCQCAAGAYLVKIEEDGVCSCDVKEFGTEPGCSRIELMEANPWHFNVATYPCAGGQCAGTSATAQSANGYGPGSSIDSTMPYTVQTRFWADYYTDTGSWALNSIETTLTQGGNSVQLIQNDSAIMNAVAWDLYLKYATSVSSFYAGSEFDNPGGVCSAACADSTNFVSNIRWVTEDSVNFIDPEPPAPEPDTQVWGPAASNVD